MTNISNLQKNLDAYFFKYLSYHLLEAGSEHFPNLYRLVDQDYLQLRIENQSPLDASIGFLGDIDNALTAASSSANTSVEEFIRCLTTSAEMTGWRRIGWSCR